MASVLPSTHDRERWLMQQPVPVLRMHAEECNVNLSNCLEKGEMVQCILVHEANAPPRPPPQQANRHVAADAPAGRAAADEQIARRIAAADLQRQAAEDRAQRLPSGMMHIPFAQSTPPDAVPYYSQPAPPVPTNDPTSLQNLAQRGFAVDLGSMHQRARRAEQQRRQAQASHAAQEFAQSQQMAYDYGRPSHFVQPPHVDHLPEPSQRTQRTQQMSSHGRSLPSHIYDQVHQHDGLEGRSGHGYGYAAGRNAGRPTAHPVHASFFDILAGNVMAGPQNHAGFFQVPQAAEPVTQGVDARTINATTGTMTFPGASPASVSSVTHVSRPRTITGSISNTSAASAEATRTAAAAPTAEVNTAQTQCSVCLEAFRAGEELRVLPCFHRYHMQCIDQWLARSPACPICKHRIVAGG